MRKKKKKKKKKTRTEETPAHLLGRRIILKVSRGDLGGGHQKGLSHKAGHEGIGVLDTEFGLFPEFGVLLSLRGGPPLLHLLRRLDINLGLSFLPNPELST